jgi:hypothetical protein
MKRVSIFLATAFDPEFSKDAVQRTDLCEPTLEQVQTNECREEQEIAADEYWAGFNAQCQRQQDEKTGDDADDAFCVHA